MMSPRREATGVASLRGDSPRIFVKHARWLPVPSKFGSNVRELRIGEAAGVSLHQAFHLEQNGPRWRWREGQSLSCRKQHTPHAVDQEAGASR